MDGTNGALPVRMSPQPGLLMGAGNGGDLESRRLPLSCLKVPIPAASVALPPRLSHDNLKQQLKMAAAAWLPALQCWPWERPRLPTVAVL